MTREDVIRLMPQASEDTIRRTIKNDNAASIKRNCETNILNHDQTRGGNSESNTYQTRSQDRHSSVLEQDSFLGALGQAQIQTHARLRILVRITSVRKRLLDEDNLCEKYIVDLLRYSGVIHDDAPDKTKIEICQRKTIKGEPESNLIEVFQEE